MRSSDRAPRFRPGRATLLTAAGIALVLAFTVAACRSRTAPDVGAPIVTVLESARPTTSAPEPEPGPARIEAPRRLLIPALDLEATVTPAGVRDGEFAVPPSVDEVGWYKFGPGLEATAGSIVISGHVDSAEQGKGAFFRLGKLRPGDRITVTGKGAGREFSVVARERYAKTAIPLEKYFARDGAARLTLITCGGQFDRRTGHYRDNVVVTAVPMG
ncbi:class F sortase [Actinoplanes sp. NPDC051494]|uniref:class F sortase n=1 Tax=Actinoplanes sp. NPDC051494 TaxID=3363907 RepID=UPI00379C488D